MGEMFIHGAERLVRMTSAMHDLARDARAHRASGMAGSGSKTASCAGKPLHCALLFPQSILHMALKATVVKAELQLSDLDRHHYATYPLTLAQHPSETGQRLMVRLIAFALFASERLEFGKGLSTEEEPDLWRRDYTGDIEQWIDLGQPDESRVRKACGRARQVIVVNYGGRIADLWWDKNSAALARLDNVTVIDLDTSAVDALAAAVERSMRFNALIQDGELQLMGNAGTVVVHVRTRHASATQAR